MSKEDIFAFVSHYLDDEEFTDSLVLTSRNDWLRKRRDDILRHKSANKLCCIFEDLKDFILNDDENQLSSDFLKDDKIEIIKIFRDEFLSKTSLKLKHQFSPREKKRYVKSKNLMMIDGKPKVSDFEYLKKNKIIDTNLDILDPVYRMKPFQKRLLIRNYPNVKAIIY